jgi:nucleoside-diphosphate-sugar epimerase
MKVAVTGPTGAIGHGVVEELVDRGHDVVPIGRAGKLSWDLARPLPRETLAAMCSADAVVHCAADVRVGTSTGELRTVNVGAVRHLVESLEGSRPSPRLVHLSSAFAAPDEGDHNSCARSKWATEQIVRDGRLDSVIVRPSLVIGRTGTGEMHRYSGIFASVRMLRLGLVPAIPGLATALVDLVPVDLLCDVIVGELESPSAPRAVVHATSGRSSPTLHELLDIIYELFAEEIGERLERPNYVTPHLYRRVVRPLIADELTPQQMALLDTVEVFLPCSDHDHAFESTLGLPREILLDTWRESIRGWTRQEAAAQSSGDGDADGDREVQAGDERSRAGRNAVASRARARAASNRPKSRRATS